MEKYNLVAKTFAGIESLLAEELRILGAENIQIHNRAVTFEGDTYMMYKANFCCRTALRILKEVHQFKFRNNGEFYDHIFEYAAENVLDKKGTLAVTTVMNQTIFKTPLYAALLAKDAICDRFRDLYGVRPDVDKENPDVQFHIAINRENATLYLDSSGGSLHKRGYRVANHPAPINEVVAAAMIQLSEWKKDCDFIDFMCGSGTLLIEAAMYALNIPAGYFREAFGFINWLDFDVDIWKKVESEVVVNKDFHYKIYGSDISPRFVAMAQENIVAAELEDYIQVYKSDFINTKPQRVPAMVIINPPYGERLKSDDLNFFYKTIGDTLKKNYTNTMAYIISSDMEALKNIGLYAFRNIPLYNGALECKMKGYHLFEGKKGYGQKN